MFGGLEARQASSSELDDDVDRTLARSTGKLALHALDVSRNAIGWVIAAEDDGELVVPDASAPVLGAAGRVQHFGDVAEKVVAGGVSVAVVGRHDPVDHGEDEHVAVVCFTGVRAVSFEQI
jgi:hypothetical protein